MKMKANKTNSAATTCSMTATAVRKDNMSTALMGLLRIATGAAFSVFCFYWTASFTNWFDRELAPSPEWDIVVDGDTLMSSRNNVAFVWVGLPIIFAVMAGAAYEALWLKTRLPWLTTNITTTTAAAAATTPKIGTDVSHFSRLGNDNNSSSRYLHSDRKEGDEDDDGDVLGDDSAALSADADMSKKSRMRILAATVSGILNIKWRLPWNVWVTVGEILVALMWIGVCIFIVYKGVHDKLHHNYIGQTGGCEENPAQLCYIEPSRNAGERAPSRNQFNLASCALYLAFVGLFNMAGVFLPVSRTSRLWAAVGVPFERAILYHVVLGHAAMWSIALHALLYVSYWISFKGWDYAWKESTSWINSQSVMIPSGWLAFFCLMPMWITSLSYFRRNYYSLFKMTHWLFWPMLLFASIHYRGLITRIPAVFSLYLAHLATRLSSWNRWKLFRRVTKKGHVDTSACVLHAQAVGDYSVIVLQAPGSPVQRGAVPIRGGSFLYMSCPGALAQGANEAHAVTIGLRGPPPGTGLCYQDVNCCTMYVKALGTWSKALQRQVAAVAAANDPGALIIDTDGPYTRLDAITAEATTCRHVVMFAGGSGLTSFLGLLQDWGTASTSGAPGPTIHLIWISRDLQELETLGSSLPTITAAAKSRLRISLHYTGKATPLVNGGHDQSSHAVPGTAAAPYSGGGGGDDDSCLMVRWPREPFRMSQVEGPQEAQVHKTIRSFWPSVVDLGRAIVSISGYYGGVMWANDIQTTVAHIEKWQFGALVFICTTLLSAIALLIYEILLLVVIWRMLERRSPAKTSLIGKSSGNISSGGGVVALGKIVAENETDDASLLDTVAMPVSMARPDVTAVLESEKTFAEQRGYCGAQSNGCLRKLGNVNKVRVLVSGPEALTHAVMDAAKKVDGVLFNAEEFSFAF